MSINRNQCLKGNIPKSYIEYQNYRDYYQSFIHGSTVIIPHGVTEIKRNAYLGCTSIETVVIPNTVQTIGDRAFEGCTSLKDVTIPNSVTELGYAAFRKCESLKVCSFLID